jgi:predicted MFS family arabinose efflux permease
MRLLLDHANFRNLWAASTVSTFGTMFGALTLTALIYLDGTPAQLGVLAAATSAPVFLLALAAGVWVDRLPRVPLMIGADVGRMVALATVPAAAFSANLHMTQLYVVAFVVGCLDVTFGIAFRSALPAVVPGERLVDANSTLGVSDSVAATASPAVGGAIAQAASAAIAVMLDALTFLASALFLRQVRGASVAHERRRRSVRLEAMEGLRAVLRQPALRAIFAMVLSYSFFSGFILTLHGLWVIEGLGFSAFTFGILLASGGVGSLAGAWLAGPSARRLGLGRSIVATYMVAAALSFLTPLAGGPAWLALLMLLSEQCVGDIFWTIHNVQATSLRQAITPDEQLGRVNAVFLLASQGLRPLGAIVAGVAAGVIGLKGGLLISAVGINVAGLWLILSPLRRMRDPLAPPQEPSEN